MVLMHPGYFPDTAFPDRYWGECYWCGFDVTEEGKEVINRNSHINISRNINSDINIISNNDSKLTRVILRYSETDSDISISKYSELIV